MYFNKYAMCFQENSVVEYFWWLFKGYHTELSMIICLSTNVPLNADHGLLFGIFIRALVLSTFLIWKVNGSFIHSWLIFFISSSPCEMRFFLLFNLHNKFKS